MTGYFMKKFLSSIVALSITFAPVASACTAINLTAKDGTVIAGRTMEWPVEMKWTLMSQPQGSPVLISAPDFLNMPSKTLSSKYAFVGIYPAVIIGSPAILEGQNEAGLGLSGNFLPGFTEFQKVTPQDDEYVSIVNFGSLVLGMFSTVKDLKAALPNYKVWYNPSEVKGSPTAPLLHFVLTDRSGDSIIVEFVKGQMVIYDNVTKVLTNAPTYDWHINNVRNYLSLTDTATTSLAVNGTSVTDIGQGGGLIGLSADYTPPSRFVRATYLNYFAYQPNGSDDAVQLMAHLLNNVDIPKGVSRMTAGNKVVSDYTQWVNLKDLENNRMKIADYSNRTNYIEIDLNQVFESGKSLSWPVDQLPYPSNDMTSQLLK